MSHTAGICGYRYRPNKLTSHLQSAIQQVTNSTFPLKILDNPGTVVTYAPLGYTVLQAILEDMYTKSFSSILTLASFVFRVFFINYINFSPSLN